MNEWWSKAIEQRMSITGGSSHNLQHPHPGNGPVRRINQPQDLKSADN